MNRISNTSSTQDTPSESKIIIDTPLPEAASSSKNVKESVSNPSVKNPNKRKTFRIERAIQRVMNKSDVSREDAIETFKNKVKQTKVKSLEEFLKEADKPGAAHKLEVGINSFQ